MGIAARLLAFLLVAASCSVIAETEPLTKSIEPTTIVMPTTTTSSTTTTTTSSTTTSTTTTSTTMPTTTPATYPSVSLLTPADIACATIEMLPQDHYLEAVTDFCLPVAWALTDLIATPGPNTRMPEFSFEDYWHDVLHMLYIVAFESGGDPLANSVNWGCPRNERLRPEDESVCAYFGSRVPTGWISHMSHLVEERSMRLLGFMIDPYSLYEASLLGFALVYEIGGNGWFHWWHVSWGMNTFTSRHGIAPTWYCPPDAYWGDVRGGFQECPVG